MGYFGIPIRNGLPIGLGSLVGFGIRSFEPNELFAAGEQGTWYDPSDFSTLFQDSAGTTPVTGVEQVVGLMLDKSKGLVLGPELIAGAASAYTGNGTVSTTGDTVTATCTTNGVYGIRWASSNISNIWTRCTFEVVVNSASKSLNFYPNLNHAGVTVGTATGSKTYTLFAPTASGGNEVPVFFINGLAGESFSIRLVSIRELAGNHATATGSARPTLSARVNLLTKTEQFDDAVWAKNNANVSANAIAAPDGTLTADELSGNGILSDHRVGQTVSALGGATFSIYLKQGTERYGYLYILGRSATNDGSNTVYFDLQTGTITSSSGTDAVVPTITNVVNGWYRLTMGRSTAFSGSTQIEVRIGVANAANVQASTASGHIFIWGADLRVSNDGVGIPAYQRVNTATDYDTAGFPVYLAFGGAQAMSTPANVDFATVTSDGQARRNLLNNPTQFDVTASWNTTRTTVTANTTVAPDGTTTAETVTATATTGFHYVNAGVDNSLSRTGTFTYSFYVKRSNNDWIFFTINDSFINYFNLATGQFGTTPDTCTATDVGNGWYRITATRTLSAQNSNCGIGVANANGGGSFTAVGTEAVFVYGSQLETGSTATAFQNIGTDKMTVFAGVRKLSDAAQAVVAELSATIASNNGTFLLAAPDGATQTYGWDSKGTTQVDAVATGFAAPITNVVTGTADIAGDSCIIRVNGTVADTEIGDQGSGNYGSYPLYIGARNLASLFFTGRLYSLITRGAQTDSASVAATEAWVNQRTAAY